MHELMGASVIRATQADGPDLWRAKVTLVGSTVEREFEDRMVAWRFVWRWLSHGRGES